MSLSSSSLGERRESENPFRRRPKVLISEPSVRFPQWLSFDLNVFNFLVGCGDRVEGLQGFPFRVASRETYHLFGDAWDIIRAEEHTKRGRKILIPEPPKRILPWSAFDLNFNVFHFLVGCGDRVEARQGCPFMVASRETYHLFDDAWCDIRGL